MVSHSLFPLHIPDSKITTTPAKSTIIYIYISHILYVYSFFFFLHVSRNDLQNPKKGFLKVSKLFFGGSHDGLFLKVNLPSHHPTDLVFLGLSQTDSILATVWKHPMFRGFKKAFKSRFAKKFTKKIIQASMQNKKMTCKGSSSLQEIVGSMCCKYVLQLN